VTTISQPKAPAAPRLVGHLSGDVVSVYCPGCERDHRWYCGPALDANGQVCGYNGRHTAGPTFSGVLSSFAAPQLEEVPFCAFAHHRGQDHVRRGLRSQAGGQGGGAAGLPQGVLAEWRRARRAYRSAEAAVICPHCRHEMREDFVSGLWTVLADPLEIYFAGKLLTLQKRLARLLRELIREGVVSHRTAFHISTHGTVQQPRQRQAKCLQAASRARSRRRPVGDRDDHRACAAAGRSRGRRLDRRSEYRHLGKRVVGLL
jgi:hypothetical protein